MVKLRAFAAHAVLILFPVTVVAVVAGVLFGGAWALLATPLPPAFGFMVATILFLSFVWSLRSAKPTPPKPVTGLAVTSAEHPQFAADVHALAMAVGTQTPHEVVLTNSGRIAATEQSGQVSLQLAFPQLAGLTVTQARAAIAHELGRFAPGDHQLSAAALRHRRTLLSAQRNASGFAATLMTVYVRLYFWVSHGVIRDAERAATERAVQAVGSKAVHTMLHRQVLADSAWESFNEEYLDACRTAKARAPMATGFAEFLQSVTPILASPVKDKIAREKAEWSSNVIPVKERLEFLTGLPDTPVRAPQPAADVAIAPAITMLHNGDFVDRYEATYFPANTPSTTWNDVLVGDMAEQTHAEAAHIASSILTHHRAFARETQLSYAQVISLFGAPYGPEAPARFSSIFEVDETKEHDSLHACVVSLLLKERVVHWDHTFAEGPVVRISATGQPFSVQQLIGAEFNRRTSAHDILRALESSAAQIDINKVITSTSSHSGTSDIIDVRDHGQMAGAFSQALREDGQVCDVVIWTGGVMLVPHVHSAGFANTTPEQDQAHIQALATKTWDEQAAIHGTQWFSFDQVRSATIDQVPDVVIRIQLTNEAVVSLHRTAQSQLLNDPLQHLHHLLGNKVSASLAR